MKTIEKFLKIHPAKQKLKKKTKRIMKLDSTNYLISLVLMLLPKWKMILIKTEPCASTSKKDKVTLNQSFMDINCENLTENKNEHSKLFLSEYNPQVLQQDDLHPSKRKCITFFLNKIYLYIWYIIKVY